MDAIDMSNTRANMAFVGEVPWHGLGQKLTEGQSIETWKKEAGMDWELKPAVVSYEIEGRKKSALFNKKRVLYRSDTKAPLSVVSAGYRPVQPGQVLEFYRDLVEVLGYELDTAGCLQGGRKYWALAKVNKSIKVSKKDILDAYLLLATSCDGTLSTVAKLTSVRTVCLNTLYAALRDGKQATVRVTHNSEFNPEAVKDKLGIFDTTWSEFSEIVKQLSSRKVSDKEKKQFLINTLGDPSKPDDEQPHERIMKQVMESIENGPGAFLPTAKDTAWGLVNGVTYFFDHARGSRSADSKLYSAWFAQGAQYKQKALEQALALGV